MKTILFALFVALILNGCEEDSINLDDPNIQQETIFAAKNGDAIAQNNLGLMYEQGKGN